MAEQSPKYKVVHLPGSLSLINLSPRPPNKMSKRAYVEDEAEETEPPKSQEPHNSPSLPQPQPQHSNRTKTSDFNAEAIKKMGYTFELPETMTKLRTKTEQPWQLGVAVGMLLYYISPLISGHLDNPVDFQNKVPGALSWSTGFVPAIDQYIAYLRLTDGCSEKFPSDREVARKDRKRRRKYFERYLFMVEAAFKNHVREVMADVFDAYSQEQTREFNKGVDKALSGVQWMVYPVKNVAFEAGEGDWAVWIRGKCEELGMAEAHAGRKVLQEI